MTKGRINIREWTKGLNHLNILSREEYDDIIKSNEQKSEFFKKYHLPTNKIYGKISSISELKTIIPITQQKKGRFWLRCIPKQDSKTITMIDLEYTQLQKNIIAMKKKAEYTYQVIEYWKGSYAGTIIADRGTVIQELWRGDHVDSEKIRSDRVFIQSINLTTDEKHFTYNKNTGKKERQIMIDALRFFVKTMDLEQLAELQIYADYIYREGKGYAFLDGSELAFWTRISQDIDSRERK